MKALFFTADWCPTCKRLKPFIDKLKETYDIEYVNIEENPGLAEAYDISSIPQVIVDTAEKTHRLINPKPSEVKDLLASIENQ